MLTAPALDLGSLSVPLTKASAQLQGKVLYLAVKVEPLEKLAPAGLASMRVKADERSGLRWSRKYVFSAWISDVGYFWSAFVEPSVWRFLAEVGRTALTGRIGLHIHLDPILGPIPNKSQSIAPRC